VDGEATRLDPPLRFESLPAALRIRTRATPRHPPRPRPMVPTFASSVMGSNRQTSHGSIIHVRSGECRKLTTRCSTIWQPNMVLAGGAGYVEAFRRWTTCRRIIGRTDDPDTFYGWYKSCVSIRDSVMILLRDVPITIVRSYQRLTLFAVTSDRSGPSPLPLLAP
jgi:hypothetical protein